MFYETKQVRSNRGKPRLYFQTKRLAACGFIRGRHYSLHQEEGCVRLRIDPEGANVVCGKGEGEKAVAVIDINSFIALELFKGMGAVRVVFTLGVIEISTLASERAAAGRLERLKSNLDTSLAVAGLAFGAGILDNAVHDGLMLAGIASQASVVNEINVALLEHASGANPVITPKTLMIAAPMQEAVQDEALMASLPYVDVLCCGIPCSGASLPGRVRNGIAMMESHPEVGHLVHAFLTFVQKLQPSVLVLENVENYASSASASIIRQQLRDMVYSTHEVVLDARDFGSIEGRVRWFLVAATRGINLDLKNLAPPVRAVHTVSDYLDDHQEHRWSRFDHLKSKAISDKAAGKYFSMQLVDPGDSKVPVLRRGYAKAGSTDPLLRHPTDPDLLRLFSGDEHARIKGVNPALVAGLSNTNKHIALGQGVAPGMVVALMKRIGEDLKQVQLPDLASEPRYRLDRAVG